MKDLTKEWIKKSEGDVGTAVRESSVKEGTKGKGSSLPLTLANFEQGSTVGLTTFFEANKIKKIGVKS